MVETQVQPSFGIRAARASVFVLATALKAFQAFIISLVLVAIGGVMGLLFTADPSTTTFSDFLTMVQSPALRSLVVIVALMAMAGWMIVRGSKLKG